MAKTMKKKSSKAFTLLELVIAMGILSLIVVSVIASYIGFMTQLDISRSRILAINDASTIIERIRKIDDTVQIVAAYPNGGAVAGFGTLPASVNEQVVVSYTNPNGDPLEVLVVVTWAQGARNLSQRLVAIITSRK